MLSGGLPNHICGRLPRLERLDLALNEFSGEIPLNLSQCSKLKILALSANNFSEAYLPKEIGNSQTLEELYLRQNNLKGMDYNFAFVKFFLSCYNNLIIYLPILQG
jgi:LRR receptor-like serine/threonine-protein kinase FLS2